MSGVDVPVKVGTLQSAGTGGRGLTAVIVLVCLAGVFWFTTPTLATLHSRWLDITYSHGYLTALLTVMLVARELRRAPPQVLLPSRAGLVCLLLCVLGMIAGHGSSTQIVALLLLPALWFTVFWTLAGWQTARRFLLPIGYLYFAIPFWEVVNEPLRGLTVAVVSLWVRDGVGLPAFIEGDQIHIPSGTFEVAGGCSGLHFLIVGLALAAFTALWHHDRWRPRLVLMLVALCLSLFANWVRVFILVIVGHLTEMQHYLIVDNHYYFGWVVFLICLAPLFVLARWLERPAAGPTHQEVGGQVAFRSRRHMFVAGLAAGVLAAGIWLNQRVAPDAGTSMGTEPLDLPVISGWRRVAEWNDERRPSFVGAGAEAAGWYVQSTARVGVYVAHYPVQRQQHEVVFYGNRPEGATGKVSLRSRRFATTSAGVELAFTEIEVEDSAGGRLLWHAMRVAGMQATGDLAAKVLQLLGAVSDRHDAQALVLAVDCAGNCDFARSSLSRFAAAAAEKFFDCATVRTEMQDSLRRHGEELCHGDF